MVVTTPPRQPPPVTRLFETAARTNSTERNRRQSRFSSERLIIGRRKQHWKRKLGPCGSHGRCESAAARHFSLDQCRERSGQPAGVRHQYAWETRGVPIQQEGTGSRSSAQNPNLLQAPPTEGFRYSDMDFDDGDDQWTTSRGDDRGWQQQGANLKLLIPTLQETAANIGTSVLGLGSPESLVGGFRSRLRTTSVRLRFGTDPGERYERGDDHGLLPLEPMTIGDISSMNATPRVRGLHRRELLGLQPKQPPIGKWRWNANWLKSDRKALERRLEEQERPWPPLPRLDPLVGRTRRESPLAAPGPPTHPASRDPRIG
jgi:hypothetical protein